MIDPLAGKSKRAMAGWTGSIRARRDRIHVDRGRPARSHGDRLGAPAARRARYLEWLHDPDPPDSVCTVDYVCLLREAGKPVRVVQETHTFGLFARAEWLGFLHETGFVAEVLIDGYGRELFLARKPA